MKTKLYRNASVDLNVAILETKPQVHIVIDGEVEHTFGESSRITKALGHMTPEQIQDRMDGGSFFTAEDDLVDFRYSDYNGFVHSEENIDALKEHVGISAGKSTGRQNMISSDVFLGAAKSEREIQVPEFGAGGLFNSELSFIWSPFVKNVNSVFNILRLVCANGMIGRTSLLNTAIPLVNRWEEHLEIANLQIQNKVEGIVIDRVQSLNDSRASVQMLGQLYAHAIRRFDDPMIMPAEQARLANIMNAVSPRTHLSDVYPAHMLKDTNVTAQLPGHMSQFDAYNIATEIRSHTRQVSGSTDNALDKFGSDLMFNKNLPKFTHNRSVIDSGCSFSNPDKAFFGAV